MNPDPPLFKIHHKKRVSKFFEKNITVKNNKTREFIRHIYPPSPFLASPVSCLPAMSRDEYPAS